MGWLRSRKGPSGNWQGHKDENGHCKVYVAGFMMEKLLRVVHRLRLVDNKDGKNQAIDLFPFFFDQNWIRIHRMPEFTELETVKE